MARYVIEIEGLNELRAALKEADSRFPRLLKRAFDEVGLIIVQETIPSIQSQLVMPPQTGNLVASVRALSTQTEGRVQMGYDGSVPYAGWWEFGGSGPNGNPRPRAFVSEGRSLYPSLRKRQTEIEASLDEKLDELRIIIEEG